MNNIVQLGCLFSKLPRLFVNFPSGIVVIFYRDPYLDILIVPLRLSIILERLLIVVWHIQCLFQHIFPHEQSHWQANKSSFKVWQKGGILKVNLCSKKAKTSEKKLTSRLGGKNAFWDLSIQRIGQWLKRKTYLRL